MNKHEVLVEAAALAQRMSEFNGESPSTNLLSLCNGSLAPTIEAKKIATTKFTEFEGPGRDFVRTGRNAWRSTACSNVELDETIRLLHGQEARNKIIPLIADEIRKFKVGSVFTNRDLQKRLGVSEACTSALRGLLGRHPLLTGLYEPAGKLDKARTLAGNRTGFVRYKRIPQRLRALND